MTAAEVQPLVLLGIDPGSTHTDAVLCWWFPWSTEPPWGLSPSFVYHQVVNEQLVYQTMNLQQAVVCETIKTIYARGGGARSIAVGTDQLEAVRWSGEFRHAARRMNRNPAMIRNWFEVERQTAKAATIGRANGTDAEVKAAIEGMYGGALKAYGKKGKVKGGAGEVPPGPLVDFKGKGSGPFAALAVLIAAVQPGGVVRAAWERSKQGGGA